jgi:hypothetical protein
MKRSYSCSSRSERMGRIRFKITGKVGITFAEEVGYFL